MNELAKKSNPHDALFKKKYRVTSSYIIYGLKMVVKKGIV